MDGYTASTDTPPNVLSHRLGLESVRRRYMSMCRVHVLYEAVSTELVVVMSDDGGDAGNAQQCQRGLHLSI